MARLASVQVVPVAYLGGARIVEPSIEVPALVGGVPEYGLWCCRPTRLAGVGVRVGGEEWRVVGGWFRHTVGP